MTLPPHHGGDGRFRNPWPDSNPAGLSGVGRWTLQRLRARMRGTLPKDPPASAFLLAEPEIAASTGPDEWRVTWVGHSTCLIQAGGLTILTDPMWSDYASPVQGIGPRRRVAPGAALGELPPLDLVLISHNHYDHFDTATIRALAIAHPSAQWVCPLGVAPALRSLGVTAVRQFDWWERHEIRGSAGTALVTAAPAQHFSGRTPWDRDRTLWCGWSVGAGGIRIFFAGDTGLHPEFARIGETCGPFAAALMPIGAYDPRWFMRPVHMNPEDAVAAFVALGGDVPCVFVPTHWGTIKLTDEALDEPPVRLVAEWARRGLDPGRLRVLRHGETTRSFPP